MFHHLSIPTLSIDLFISLDTIDHSNSIVQSNTSLQLQFDKIVTIFCDGTNDQMSCKD